MEENAYGMFAISRKNEMYPPGCKAAFVETFLMKNGKAGGKKGMRTRGTGTAKN